MTMIRNETVAYYDNPDNDYAAKTVGADMSHIYPRFLKYLPKNSSLLDVGCGSGRDSLYFLKNGYAVTSIDSSLKMCEYAEQLLQQPVLHQNFEDIDYHECFNGIWACASLLHVQEQNMCNVIRKLFAALVDGGVLYASWKLGDHERIESSTGRLFCDMSEERIFTILAPIDRISVCELWISDDVRDSFHGQSWLNIIVKKCVVTAEL